MSPSVSGGDGDVERIGSLENRRLAGVVCGVVEMHPLHLLIPSSRWLQLLLQMMTGKTCLFVSLNLHAVFVDDTDLVRTNLWMFGLSCSY